MSRARSRSGTLSADDEAWIEEAAYAPPTPGGVPDLMSDAMTHNVTQTLAFFNGTIERYLPDTIGLPLGERVTAAAVEAFKRDLALTNKPRSVHDILTRLAILCRRLGFVAQAEIVAGVAGRAPSRPRKRAPAISAAAIYHELRARFAGLREEIAALGNGKRASARRRRAADEAMTTLMMILLLTLPVRRRNLIGLALGTTLRQVRGTWIIVMESQETKGRRAAIRVIPQQLAACLDAYLAEIRPIRTKASSGEALWLSPKGKALPAITAHNRIRSLAMVILGVKLSMHLFRQIVGRWAAGEGGLGLKAAQLAFQHADLTTTLRSYIEQDTAQAQRAMRPNYQSITDALDIDFVTEWPKSTCE